MKKILLCIALLPICAACSDSKDTAVSPTPANPVATVRISHDLFVFTAPDLAGSAPSGTIDWGDGSRESYSAPATHTYTATAPRTVTIKARGVDRMTLTDLEGISAIDLSAFTAN